jgi:hypothetical protein
MRTVVIPLGMPRPRPPAADGTVLSPLPPLKVLAGHGGVRISEIKLREPSFDEYLEHGDPYTIAQAPGSGIPFMLEDKAAIAAYVHILVVEPADKLLLKQGGMALAQAIKEKVLDFFRPAGEAGEGSKT